LRDPKENRSDKCLVLPRQTVDVVWYISQGPYGGLYTCSVCCSGFQIRFVLWQRSFPSTKSPLTMSPGRRSGMWPYLSLISFGS